MIKSTKVSKDCNQYSIMSVFVIIIPDSLRRLELSGAQKCGAGAGRSKVVSSELSTLAFERVPGRGDRSANVNRPLSK